MVIVVSWLVLCVFKFVGFVCLLRLECIYEVEIFFVLVFNFELYEDEDVILFGLYIEWVYVEEVLFMLILMLILILIFMFMDNIMLEVIWDVIRLFRRKDFDKLYWIELKWCEE